MNELRDAVKNRYATILGRNQYSQNMTKRQCVYKPHTDGQYYSDCASSYLNTLFEEGVIDWHEGNTATIHEKGELVDVQIVNGVPDEADLLVGDALLFKGNDPSRPLQIGHIEMYAGNGRLYGHGSGTPSEKDLVEYCRNRWSQKAQNGVRKALCEVRRFIPHEEPEQGIKGQIFALVTLNVRTAPDKTAKVCGSVKAGQKITATKKCNKWFFVPEVNGWISAKYLEGWVQESNGRWWYLLKDYRWHTSTVVQIGGEWYAFDPEGWMITADRIGSSGAIK